MAKWDATLKARYFGLTEAAGISDLYVNIIVTELAPGGPYRVLMITLRIADNCARYARLLASDAQRLGADEWEADVLLTGTI